MIILLKKKKDKYLNCLLTGREAKKNNIFKKVDFTLLC